MATPTQLERAHAGAGPLALKPEGTRDYWIQTLDLARGYLQRAEDYLSALRILRDVKDRKGYRILGYKSHQQMVDGEGIGAMLKAARAIVIKQQNPGMPLAEVGRLALCSTSHAAAACKAAGLKEPTFKDIIQRDHIKPDGTLHIDNEPASQRDVAKVVGCGRKPVEEALAHFSSTGKVSHPAPSPALLKAQAAFRRLTKEDQNAFGLWLNEQPR